MWAFYSQFLLRIKLSPHFFKNYYVNPCSRTSYIQDRCLIYKFKVWVQVRFSHHTFVYFSNVLIVGGFHHFSQRFECFFKLYSHYRWLSSNVLLFLQLVLSLQVAAIIDFTLLQFVLSLQVVAIGGLNVFASCPVITGGCHHRFDCFCRMSCDYRWLPSKVWLFMQIVLSLQDSGVKKYFSKWLLLMADICS